MAIQHATRLLKCMCKEIGYLDFKIAAPVFNNAVLVASELGVHEVVEEIIETFPGAIYSSGAPSGQYILHKAIENRSKDVFNLVYQMSDHGHVREQRTKMKGDTMKPSSIATVVHGRTDRVKKKKDPDFTTPRTTPKKKKLRTEKTPDTIFMEEGTGEEEESNSKEKKKEKDGVSRVADRSYAVREKLEADEMEALDSFVDKGLHGDEHVWVEGVVAVRASSILECMYDAVIEGSLIDAYLTIICSKEYQERYLVTKQTMFLNTFTVTNILELTKGGWKKKRYSRSQYRGLLSMMVAPARLELGSLIGLAENSPRYLILPICSYI